ncbi:Cloroperoxidase [Penicillium chermesinum]|nr:Cloroperoxidase [Penicillium chermesinum]
MLNTLANHGYLPHDGKNISQDQVVTALVSALNFDEETAIGQFQQALASNPVEGATTFSLADLRRHKVVEHDASLSRQDYYFSKNDHSFNAVVFAETLMAWGSEINVKSAAQARHARISTSKATNPSFSTDLLDSGYGESAVLIATIGDANTATANKAWAEYLFRNERLPTALGWEKPKYLVTGAVVGGIAGQIEAK